THGVKSCIHFAALGYVGESVEMPARYFENNVAEGIALLGALLDGGVNRFVFSSTCATYGEPMTVPMSEQHPQQPTNPYGWSKLFIERIMQAYDVAYGLKFVALGYFNAAGATHRLGEDHQPETHLVPNVLAAAQGEIPAVSVFGNDYPTEDGTPVRDYIHVEDLGRAHILALEYLEAGGQSQCINLGNGRGYSVLQVIEAAPEVTRGRIGTKVLSRRPGDPSHLVADASKAAELLGWKPLYPDLTSILRSDWEWRQRR